MTKEGDPEQVMAQVAMEFVDDLRGIYGDDFEITHIGIAVEIDGEPIETVCNGDGRPWVNEAFFNNAAKVAALDDSGLEDLDEDVEEEEEHGDPINGN